MEGRFVHSAPVLYDRYMGPLLFESWARLVASRCAELNHARILETACGTGILTREIHKAVPSAELVATDVNPAMLEFAAEQLKSPKVSFLVADALSLPFTYNSFDLVVCQFGAMFFPDRVRASREAYRVLLHNGRYLLVSFNQLDFNPVPRAAQDAVSTLFKDNPIDYMERVPFSYADQSAIRCDLIAGGFVRIEIATLEVMSNVNAQDAAYGLVYGSPLRVEIERRTPAALERAAQEVARVLKRWDGKKAPVSAHLVIASKD